MCGRFTREFTWSEVHDFLDLVFPGECTADGEGAAEATESWNVAPTQDVLVARGRRTGDGPLEALIGLERWGFTPHWMREKKRPGPINARGETVATTPMFRRAFAGNRCVVPMSSFYEWQVRSGDAPKLPWRFHRSDGSILLAGAVRTSADDDAPATVALITVAASTDVADVHDRMPLVLDPADVPRWCDVRTSVDDAAPLLEAPPAGTLARHPVSRRVNTPRTNTPDLVEPVDEEA